MIWNASRLPPMVWSCRSRITPEDIGLSNKPRVGWYNRKWGYVCAAPEWGTHLVEYFDEISEPYWKVVYWLISPWVQFEGDDAGGGSSLADHSSCPKKRSCFWLSCAESCFFKQLVPYCNNAGRCHIPPKMNPLCFPSRTTSILPARRKPIFKKIPAC